MMVPYGYAHKRVGIDQLDNFDTWSKLQPEFKRRVRAMFVAAQGRRVGKSLMSTATHRTAAPA